MTPTIPELNFKDPHSRISNFLVYLYTIEFGSPPLYTEANRCAREMDLSLLDELGPFCHGLYFVTMWAEKGKSAGERLAYG